MVMKKGNARSNGSGPKTKSQVYVEIATSTGLSRKQVVGVFDTLAELVKKDLRKNGPGMVNVGGLMKIKVVDKPATKARQGTNPFTGEPMMFKAKPARRVVKVTALKSLKDLVGGKK